MGADVVNLFSEVIADAAGARQGLSIPESGALEQFVPQALQY